MNSALRDGFKTWSQIRSGCYCGHMPQRSRSADGPLEAHGLDVYRHLLTTGYWSNLGQFVGAARLVADIWSTRGYQEPAGILFSLAYEVAPQDAALRRSYVSYMIRQGDAMNAQAVQQGQTLRLPEVDEHDMARIFGELPGLFGASSPWWIDYRPTEPLHPIHSLGAGAK